MVTTQTVEGQHHLPIPLLQIPQWFVQLEELLLDLLLNVQLEQDGRLIELEGEVHQRAHQSRLAGEVFPD